MRILPASAAAWLPRDINPAAAIWAQTVGGGDYCSRVLARGSRVRLIDLAGDACAHVLLFNADQPWERLNVADTVKVPWQAYLQAGHPLLSDQGRVLATIVDDSSGCHDALCGTSVAAVNERRYGAGQAHSATPAGRELFKLAAAKHGLGPRDLPPSVSFFQGVRAAPDGALQFFGSAGPGRTVELRVELPVVMLIVNVPHPLDPREAYLCTPLRVIAWRDRPTSPTDPQWSRSPEIERALLNTVDYAEARGVPCPPPPM